MKKVIIILQISVGLLSCSIHCNNYNKATNQQLIGYDTNTLELVKDVPKEIKHKRNLSTEDDSMRNEYDCMRNERVQYNPVLKNECSEDIRLYVRFNLYIDSTVNDTIRIRNIEIAEIRDSYRKIVERKECEDYFLNQLRGKVYFYKCNIKRIQLECVAFPTLK